MKKYMVFYSLIITTSSQAALAAVTCESLFDEAKKTPIAAEALSEHYHTIQKQIENLFSNILDPKWNEYNQLTALLESVNSHHVLSSAEKLNLQNQYEIKNHSFESVMNEILKSDGRKAMYITNLDNNYHFYKLLEEVNSKLGVKIFPSFRLELVKSSKETIRTAEKYLEKMTADFEKDFSITNFKNMDEFRESVKKVSPESAQLLSDMQQHLYVTIQRPENARFWLPLTGFQNQRVTGTSKGTYDPEGRESAEINYLNMSDYSTQSSRFKVKNMALNINFEKTGLKRNESNLNQFGSDHWIVKKSVLEKRATYTVSNSFVFGREVGAIEPAKRTILDRSIPWKYRELLLPYASKYAASNVFSPSTIDPRYNLKDLMKSTEGYGYFEVQILGDLALTDMEALHFKGNPPDKKLYDYLKAHNINVFDARNHYPVPYNP